MTIQLTNPKHIARLAGFLYFLLIPLGFFGVTYVTAALIVSGDAAATVNNIIASESLYRLSMVSALWMNVVSIVLVLVLYKLLEPVNKNQATLMVVFLVVGAGIAMLNELNHFAALAVSLSEGTAVFTAEQSQYLVHLFLNMYEFGAYTATIFWGLWLFPLGYLIFKSNFLPKVLGVLLIIAGIGYLIDSFMLFLAPQFPITITSYTFIGEIAILLWLLIKGVDVEQWNKRTLEVATS